MGIFGPALKGEIDDKNFFHEIFVTVGVILYDFGSLKEQIMPTHCFVKFPVFEM